MEWAYPTTLNQEGPRAAPPRMPRSTTSVPPGKRSRRMSEKPVYCKHKWDALGPKSSRAWQCAICCSVWKEYENPTPPKFIIGYVEDNDKHKDK